MLRCTSSLASTSAAASTYSVLSCSPSLQSSCLTAAPCCIDSGQHRPRATQHTDLSSGCASFFSQVGSRSALEA